MRPFQRDGFGINRPGIEVMRAALERQGLQAAILDCSERNAIQQLKSWLETGLVTFVYAQGGWGSETWTRQGGAERSIFDLFDAPFFARISVPPFAASVIHPVQAEIARKTILLSDQDALALARELAPEDTRIDHFPSVFAGFSEPVEVQREKRHTGLVVMRVPPPDTVRERWRSLFPDHTPFLDQLAERAEAAPCRPFASVLLSAMAESEIELLSEGGDAFVMLNLVNMFVTSRRKQALLSRAAAYPFHFILDGKFEDLSFHARATVEGPVPAHRLWDAYAGSAAALSVNPANMSGAVSERIPMALRAGAAIVHASNSLLREHFSAEEHFLEFGPNQDDIDRVLDRAADGRDLAPMNQAMAPLFERSFGPDAMARRLIQLADEVSG
jgi:hypothetical protein